MSTYVTTYRYDLYQKDPDVNSFKIAGLLIEPYGATESIDDGIFKTGEEVSIEYLGDDPGGFVGTFKIEGFFGDGYVVKDAHGGIQLYSNTEITSTTISLETDDTGYPGLPVCFTKGTLIDTPDGRTPIENLKVGDMVVCSKGLGRVKWVGWRHYTLSSCRMPEELRKQSAPVRIKRGCLDISTPSADLVVSPWHHIFIDGVLVRANDLINDQTIIQELDVKHVEYFHIELDQFDVIRAHGVFSESWADGGNRDFFENVDVTSLRAVDMKRRLADRPGFTVLRDQSRINAIRDKLVQRASRPQAQEEAA